MLTVEKLRSSIAAHLGQVLTPEIACAIEMGAHDHDDYAPPSDFFPVSAYKGITFQVESFREILDELHELHVAHFAETEKHLQGRAMAPNYAYMAERERAGSMLQFTARRNGTLVGNVRLYVQHSTHTGAKVAEEDTLFLLPEFRKGFVAIRLLQFCEKCLFGIGVKEVRANSKVVNRAHRLMDYLGYSHYANSYVKILGD